MSESKDLITIKDLCVHYPIRSGFFNRITDYVYAVDGVNFTIKAVLREQLLPTRS